MPQTHQKTTKTNLNFSGKNQEKPIKVDQNNQTKSIFYLITESMDDNQIPDRK